MSNGTLNFTQIYDEFVVSGHPALIHFPIFGIMMGAVAALSALAIAILLDVFDEKSWMTKTRVKIFEKFIDRFEFSSWILILIGELSMIAAAYTGFKSSGDIESAVNNELLNFKVRLSIYVFALLMAPLAMKLYFALKTNGNIFSHLYKKAHWDAPDHIHNHSRIPPVLYILPILIAAFLTVLISGAGGRYVYGHSILDTFGLGWLLPGTPP